MPQISNLSNKIKIAAAQLSPVFLDKQKTTSKVCDFIRAAGAEGASVIGFPECIIPGYPAWCEVIPMDRPLAHDLFRKLFENSVEVPGPEAEQIAAACKEAKIYAIVGVNERVAGTTGSTFNTQLMFGPDGTLLNKHQKYVPTVAERLIHSPGQTYTHTTSKTDFGALSGLICGENANPLAMYSTGLEYPTVHVASWPTHFTPEIDMQSCILNSTRGLAYSLKVFLINSCGLIDDEAIEAYAETDEIREWLVKEQGKPLSTIVGPDGNIIAGPLKPGNGILYADIIPADTIVSKYAIDVVGHYNRPELFAHHFLSHMKEGSKL